MVPGERRGYAGLNLYLLLSRSLFTFTVQKHLQRMLLANVLALGVAEFVFTGTRSDCAEALEANGVELAVSGGAVEELFAVF